MSLETHMLGLINSEHSNTIVRCIDGEYLVIKELLIARSQYFALSKYRCERRVISGELVKMQTINVNLTVRQFLPVVWWLYIGKKYVDAVDGLKIHDFAKLAHECQLMMLFELSNYFVDKIEQKIERGNVIDIMSIAREYGFDNLRHKCYTAMKCKPRHGIDFGKIKELIAVKKHASILIALGELKLPIVLNTVAPQHSVANMYDRDQQLYYKANHFE